MYTYKEIAEMFGVCTKTVMNWVRAGKLKVTKLSQRTIRITEEELENFKQKNSK